jgi:hypothetical protein
MLLITKVAKEKDCERSRQRYLKKTRGNENYTDRQPRG